MCSLSARPPDIPLLLSTPSHAEQRGKSRYFSHSKCQILQW